MSKESDNYERLQKNRQAVLEFADAINISSTPDRDKRRQEAYDAVEQGDLSAAISKLDEAKDNAIGIVWHKSDDLGQDSKALVRDARNVTNDPKALTEQAPEKYALQILNTVRGAQSLAKHSSLEVEQVQLLNAALSLIVADTMHHLKNGTLNEQQLRASTSIIVDKLEAAGITKPEEKLTYAHEMANMQDEHHHVVTLTTAKDAQDRDHTIYEAEIILSGLTEKQQKEYNAVALSKDGQDTGVQWFDQMPKYKQNILRPLAKDIAAGKKVIPTQLVGEIPGVRNAYEKTTAISGPMQNGERKILAQRLHCGTPASKMKIRDAKGKKDKDATQAVANENVEQLRSFMSKGARMNLHTLNTGNLTLPKPANPEGYIFQQMSKASKEKGVGFTSTPMNGMRKLPFVRRNNVEYTKNLQLIGDALGRTPGAEKLSGFLQEKRPGLSTKILRAVGLLQDLEKEAKKELAKLKKTNPALAKDLAVALEAKATDNCFFEGRENLSARLSANMAVLENSVRSSEGELKKLLGERVAEYSQDVDFCKSGKDRTGYVEANNTREVVSHALGVEANSPLEKANFAKQVAGNHTQQMAGMQGGTLGCHGVKEIYDPRYKDLQEMLEHKTADYNKITSKMIRDKSVRQEAHICHEDLVNKGPLVDQRVDAFVTAAQLRAENNPLEPSYKASNAARMQQASKAQNSL